MDGASTKQVWDGSNISAEISGNTVTNKYTRGINLIKDNVNFFMYNAHGDVVQLLNTSGIITKSYKYDAFGNERNVNESDTNPWRYCGEYFDKETGSVYLRARYYDPRTSRMLSEDSVRARQTNIFDPYEDYQEVKLNGGVYRSEINVSHINLNNLNFIHGKDKMIELFKNSIKEYLENKKTIYVVNDSLSLNLYTYAQNNPVRFNDPSGHTAAVAAAPPLIALGPAGWAVLGGLAVVSVAGIIYMSAEHTKGARPSTKNKHQKGQARKSRDHGGEKGDARRVPNPNKRK